MEVHNVPEASDTNTFAKIEDPYIFEFRESKKDIPLIQDMGLQEKALALYFDLNGLNLM